MAARKQPLHNRRLHDKQRVRRGESAREDDRRSESNDELISKGLGGHVHLEAAARRARQ
jgi:hypothetical protein